MNPFATINESIIAIEVLGNHKLVYIDFNGVELIAKFRSEIETPIDTDIQIFVNLEKLIFLKRNLESGFINSRKHE